MTWTAYTHKDAALGLVRKRRGNRAMKLKGAMTGCAVSLLGSYSGRGER
jgi:hypothetical protein